MLNEYCIYCGTKDEQLKACGSCYDKLQERYYKALQRIKELEDEFEGIGLA